MAEEWRIKDISISESKNDKFCIDDYEDLTFIEICNKYISSKITLDGRFIGDYVFLEDVKIEGYGENYEIKIGFEFEDEYIEINDNGTVDTELEQGYEFEECCFLWEQSPSSLISFFNKKVNKLIECDINYKKEIREEKDKERVR